MHQINCIITPVLSLEWSKHKTTCSRKENMGKNFAKILLAVIVITSITGINVVQGATTADSFQSPLAVYKVTGFTFGQYNTYVSVNLPYHAGEDLQASFGTPVRAIANGVVVQSKEDSDGYGNVFVIEHTLPDNSQICSIYGHLSREPGYKMLSKMIPDSDGDGLPERRTVVKGEIIGYIGHRAENGEWSEHLHFGIKKGAYDGTYAGDVSTPSGLAGFYKPSDYLYLIRAVGTNEVYRLSNIGDKIWIRTADDFNACGWRWDDIRPVTATELNSHTTVSGEVNFPSGTLIKMANSPEISIIKQYSDGSGTIKNRMRQHFTSWAAYTGAGGNSDLSNVRIVSPTEYYLYVQGGSIPEVPDLEYVSVSEGACMKASGYDEISAIIDGKRHPFSTWDAFMKYCEIYRPRSDLDVVTVSSDHYTSIPTGEPISLSTENPRGDILPVIVPQETVFSDGTFIRTPAYDCLAVIRDGQRCEFKTFEAFLENGGLLDLSNVEVLTEEQFDSLPAGEMIYESYPTDGTFIRTEVYDEVSLMKNGKRCPFATENAYLQAGVKSDLSDVRLVSEEMYDTLPVGATIY